MLYRIEMVDGSGNVIADLSGRHLTLEYEKSRNRPTLIHATFELYDMEKFCKDLGITVPALFATNVNEVNIYRNSTLIASGQIYYYQAFIEETTAVVDIRAYDVFSVLRYRHTTGSQAANEELFTATDAGQIAKKLIDDTQARTNGDLGITIGTIQSSVSRDRTYFVKNIYDAIIQLSEVQDGFDLELTPSKVFNVYYPKIGQIRNNVILSYPGNILSIGVERDGQNYANAVWANGIGTGTERLSYYAEDTAVQGVYKIRESQEEFPDVSSQSTLEAHAEEELRVAKSFKSILSLGLSGEAPEIGTFGIGDTLTLDIDNNYTSFDIVQTAVRVEAYSVRVNEEDFERVGLKVANV